MEFRKQMEACESVMGSALGATLPEGTDYHVRSQTPPLISTADPQPQPAKATKVLTPKVLLQYYKTFEEFKEGTQALQERVKSLMMRFPVCHPALDPNL